MENELEHSRIEQLNRNLHKQGAETSAEIIHPLQKESHDIAGAFNAPIFKADAPLTSAPSTTPPPPTLPRSMKLLRWFAVVSVSGALGAIGYFAYQFLQPSGRPSPSNIQFTIEAPVGANPGEKVPVAVLVENKNNVALDGVELVMQFPPGTYGVEGDVVSPIHEVRRNIGMVMAGESREEKFSAYILGDEQQLKTIKGMLSYRFINMGSTFTKSATREVRMLAAPITLLVDTLKRATAGRGVDVVIHVRSNTEVPLHNVLVRVDYPQGFIFDSAEPRMISSDNLWSIAELGKTDVSDIVIKGRFTNEGASERIFQTTVGVADVASPTDIAAQYAKALTAIAMESPFVDITTLFNGNVPEEAIARYGLRMQGMVTIKNKTDAPIIHGLVELSILGTGLDEKTVDAGKGGVYRAESHTIVWDERNDERLAKLLPGKEVSFVFSFVPDAGRVNGQYAANPEIVTNVKVQAGREGEEGVVGEVNTLSKSVVKIATQAEFAARTLFYSGPFKNLGELPLHVDKPTQFTVLWSVRNTSNSLDQAEVRAEIPPYVTWNNVVSPSKENVTYNPANHTIVWTVGQVPAGTGVGSVGPREVAFQLTVTPTLSQIDSSPLILEKQVFVARDTFTKNPVEIKNPPINTNLQSDPKAARNAGRVLP